MADKKETGREFKKRASLFSGKLFVKIVVYADESGTHDKTGNLPGSEVATFAGFAAKVESWIKFRKDWQAILKKYSAPYFHFSEWADASAVARNTRPATSQHTKNPYYGWPIDRLDNFFLELAEVAAAGSKVKVGGYVDTQRLAEFLNRNPKEPPSNPHEGCVWWFYESVFEAVKSKWPHLQEPMSFFYDRSGNDEWINAITKVHRSYQKVDSRIKEIAFADKKEPLHVALQAADMLAYRLRQIAAKYRQYDKRIPDSIPPFDRALFRKELQEVDEFKKLFPS
jgi:hypothetical protein